MRDVPGLKKKPSTSELLDWIKLLLAEDIPASALRDKDSRKSIPPLHGALLKNEQDVHLVRAAGVPGSSLAPAVDSGMLIKFFFMLREGGLKVSVTEMLTLLEALQSGVAGHSVDDFYYLSRAALVKDESHFDRFDRVFAAHFQGVEDLFQDISGDIPDDWLRRQVELMLSRGGAGANRSDGRLRRADAGIA